VILVHFDVLALPAATLATRQPSLEGRRLWNTFWDKYQGRVVLTAPHDTNEDVLSDWLKKEGFKPSIIQLAKADIVEGASPRADVVWDVQGVMGRIEWYVDTDPETIARALQMGVPSLLVAVPSFARPEWHQDETIRAWDVVVSELEQQALKKSERTWGDL
jgi:hypothetical protein